MKNTEIGLVTIDYNPEGILVSANFKPTMQVELSDETKQSLNENLKNQENSDVLKENSDLVLGTFFSAMTEIELADREEYEIVSEIDKCDTYENGATKQCVIKYLFQKRVRAFAQA